MSRAARWSALALSSLLASARAGGAEDRRSVAVLEFRAGVEEAKNLAGRLAERLRKSSSLQVIDPVDARRKTPRIDADVARCAGDPPCLARVGAGLEVDEVLLVGISKLGDVVLALQRIDVDRRAVSGQLSAVLNSDEEAEDKQLGAWLKQLYPPEVFKRYGYIVVSANVAGASVTVNGQSRGETPLDGKIKLPAPRSYRVELAKPDYAPFVARIDVPPEATVEVRAELTREGGVTPVYKRWWPWAIAGGVVAGGAAVGLVYAFQPDPTMVQGFIQR